MAGRLPTVEELQEQVRALKSTPPVAPTRPRQRTIPDGAPPPDLDATAQSPEPPRHAAPSEAGDPTDGRRVVLQVEPPQRRQGAPPPKLSPPHGIPASVPVSEAERNYLTERARRIELQEELARRPAPKSDPPGPFSVSSRGIRLDWPLIKRLLPWLIAGSAATGGGIWRERLLDMLGAASAAKLETETAARVALERELAAEKLARTQADDEATERYRSLTGYLWSVLPQVGVRVTLPPGVPPPEPIRMLPAPLTDRVGGGRAAPIQPDAPLPVPAPR